MVITKHNKQVNFQYKVKKKIFFFFKFIFEIKTNEV